MPRVDTAGQASSATRLGTTPELMACMATIFSRIEHELIGVMPRRSVLSLLCTFKSNTRQTGNPPLTPPWEGGGFSRGARIRKQDYETGDVDQRRPTGRMPDRDR
jgi:hypothetical protein